MADLELNQQLRAILAQISWRAPRALGRGWAGVARAAAGAAAAAGRDRAFLAAIRRTGYGNTGSS